MAFRHRVRDPVLQARIFLPKWFVKIVRPGRDLPSDTVQMQVSMDMSKIDIKNYLERIYDIPVARVQTRIQAGKAQTKFWRNDSIIYKTPDVKVAYVILKEGHTFKYPDVLPPFEPPNLDEEDPGLTVEPNHKWF